MQADFDKPDFLRAEQRLYARLRSKNEEIRRLETSVMEHEQALKLLADIPTKVKHDIMVPIGPLAFMPGYLIHTNEVTVLLGDGFFAERSAAQAAGIISRRKDFVSNALEKLKSEQSEISARTNTSDYIRKSLVGKLSEGGPEIPDDISEGEEEEEEEEDGEEEDGEEEEDDEDDEGKGFEYWSKHGFVGAWSEDIPQQGGRPPGAAAQESPGPDQPVFEIMEPADGSSAGRVIRHSSQQAFDGFGVPRR